MKTAKATKIPAPAEPRAPYMIRLSAEERAIVEAAAASVHPDLKGASWARAALLDAARAQLARKR